MVTTKHAIPQLDTKALPGPDTIHRRQLDNGMVVLARENFASPSVVVAGNLTAGSLSEPADKAGLADLTASALMRGTKARSFDEIYQTIESIGASLSIGAGSHYTSFRGKALVEDLKVILELLNDVLRSPSFPKHGLEQLRAEKLTGLALRDQDTRSVAEMTFDSLIYNGHPYSQASDGYPETVRALQASDLRAFHKQTYGPQGGIVVIVGAVEAERAIDAVEALFGDWTANGDQESLNVPNAPKRRKAARKDVVLAGKTQADLVMGIAGPRRNAADYLAAALGNSVLGRFGLFGRIGDRVREQEGLAYYAYSSVTGGIGPGPWKVNAGVNPVNVNRAIQLIKEEIQRFASKKIDKDELTDSQANFIGRLPLQLESNGGVASGLVYIERHQLGLDYYQRYPELILSISRDDVLGAAQHYLDPNLLGVAVAGPKLLEA